jgi:glucose-6-phosphate isomerase
MLYHQHLDHAYVTGGPARADVAHATQRLQETLDALIARSQPQAAALLNLTRRTDDLATIEALAASLRKRFLHAVICGSGGAGLSGHVLTQLKPKPWPLSLHYLDNIDPDSMSDCLGDIDLAHSCFLIVSKSGTTVETLSQFFLFFGELTKRVGAKAAEHFVIITTPNDNPLHQMAVQHGITLLEYDALIGGRFSTLISVGLLPAALCGLDIYKLRQGAATVVADMDSSDSPAACAPAVGAALQYCFAEHGYNISVMLPYSSRLSGFSSWYRQSWSESLGKNAQGMTPIRAVGTTDQHSQLQLYLDGPKDKLFHFISLPRAGTGAAIPAAPLEALDYLQGKTLGDVMAAEQKATLETLIRHHCPLRHFALDTLDEAVLGALLMHFTLEIIFTAALQGVNPFDQPAVEQGKQLAREYLLSGAL